MFFVLYCLLDCLLYCLLVCYSLVEEQQLLFPCGATRPCYSLDSPGLTAALCGKAACACVADLGNRLPEGLQHQPKMSKNIGNTCKHGEFDRQFHRDRKSVV